LEEEVPLSFTNKTVSNITSATRICVKLLWHVFFVCYRNKKQQKFTGTKATHKRLVKLILGVYFINVLQAAFSSADPESAKKTDHLTVFLRFWDLGV